MSETPPTFSNPQFGTRDYASAGLTTAPASENLGKRDQTGLQAAFATSPVLNGNYTAERARTTFQAYTGENTEFQYYRRDFIPQDGTSAPSDALYQNPRDKASVDVGAAKLGTAFSPTVAAPGAGNGFNYAALNSVPGLRPAAATDTASLNPIEARYANLGADPATTTGTVRTFKLGVGSTVGENRLNPPPPAAR